MAHGRPWYKRSGGDLLMACLSMPDSDHKWAFSAIIDMLNDRDRPIADDAGFICGFTGLSKRRWAIVRAWLLAHGYLFIDARGHLSEPRFARELAEREKDHERAVEAGRAGGRKSAALRAAGQRDLDLGDEAQPQNSELSPEKQAEESEINGAKSKDKPPVPATGHNKVNGLAQPPPQASRARKRLEARVESESHTTTTPSKTRALDAIELSEHLTRIAGVRNIDPARIITNQQTVREWIDLGVDVVDVERIITKARDHASRPIHSLKYFDPAVRQAQARKDHPHESDRHDPSEIADPLLRRYLESGGSLDR